MIRIVLAATSRAKKTSTATTIRPAIWTSSFGHERRGAADLHHANFLARLVGLLGEAGPGAPHLAADTHRALVGADVLEHHRLVADERGRAGANLRRHRDVTARDRPDDHRSSGGGGEEHDDLDRRAGAHRRRQQPPEGPEREGSQEETLAQDLADPEQGCNDQPPGPRAHPPESIRCPGALARSRRRRRAAGPRALRRSRSAWPGCRARRRWRARSRPWRCRRAWSARSRPQARPPRTAWPGAARSGRSWHRRSAASRAVRRASAWRSRGAPWPARP